MKMSGNLLRKVSMISKFFCSTYSYSTIPLLPYRFICFDFDIIPIPRKIQSQTKSTQSKMQSAPIEEPRIIRKELLRVYSTAKSIIVYFLLIFTITQKLTKYEFSSSLYNRILMLK